MLKLIKYELIKRRMNKFVILGIIGLLEIGVLAGFFLKNEDVLGISLALMVFAVFGSILFLTYDAIDTYLKDLSTKQSYMLFLVPRNSFEILGAKMIVGFFQLVVFGFVMLALVLFNIVVFGFAEGKASQILDAFRQFFKIFFGEVFSNELVLVACLYAVCFLFYLLALAFFVITLAHTLLANKKGSGFVAFAMFIGINIGVTRLGDLCLPRAKIQNGEIVVRTLGNAALNLEVVKSRFIFNLLVNGGFYLVISILAYLGAAWMMKKKLSV